MKAKRVTVKVKLKKYLDNNFFVVIIWLIVISLSSLITLVQGFGLIKNFYEEHIIKKELTYKKLYELRPNVQISNYEIVFGSPTLVNKIDWEDNEYKEYIFVYPEFNLQAITDQGDTVLSFAVTSKERNFNPVFKIIGWGNGLDEKFVTLNKTTFYDMETDDAICYTDIGAHDFYYFEGYYLGNPGNYKTTYVGINFAGYFDEDWIGMMTKDPIMTIDVGFNCKNVTKEFRKSATINTFVSTGRSDFGDPPIEQFDLNPWIFGANQYDVRIIED